MASTTQLNDLLRRKLEERCTSLTEAFRKVDKSGNGFITAAGLTRGSQPATSKLAWGQHVTQG